VSDVAYLFHDLDQGPTFDSTHTGTSEYRVRCGCGHLVWGLTEPGAVAEHKRHRAEAAGQIRAAVAILNACVPTEEAA
jgi:hypothetical protein